MNRLLKVAVFCTINPRPSNTATLNYIFNLLRASLYFVSLLSNAECTSATTRSVWIIKVSQWGGTLEIFALMFKYKYVCQSKLAHSVLFFITALKWISLKNANQIKHLSITSANLFANEVNQNKIREVLIQSAWAESPNVPFWHILALSVPFRISQVPNYEFNL